MLLLIEMLYGHYFRARLWRQPAVKLFIVAKAH